MKLLLAAALLAIAVPAQARENVEKTCSGALLNEDGRWTIGDWLCTGPKSATPDRESVSIWRAGRALHRSCHRKGHARLLYIERVISVTRP